MNWIDPKVQQPTQGKKILWFKEGDCFVVQRIGKYYIPMPFLDSKSFFWHEPDLWADISLPEPYTGLLRIAPDIDHCDDRFTLDELEMYLPVIYERVTEVFIKPIQEFENGNR
jgi:hypothetical protein